VQPGQAALMLMEYQGGTAMACWPAAITRVLQLKPGEYNGVRGNWLHCMSPS